MVRKERWRCTFELVCIQSEKDFLFSVDCTRWSGQPQHARTHAANETMQSAGGPSKQAYSTESPERAGGRAALFSKKLLRQQHELKMTKCHFCTEVATVWAEKEKKQKKKNNHLPNHRRWAGFRCTARGRSDFPYNSCVTRKPHDVSSMGKLQQRLPTFPNLFFFF